MWQNPRARRYARQLALQEGTFIDFVRIPGTVMAAETIRQGAFGGKLAAEQDAILWQVVQDAWAEYRGGRLVVPQLIQLLLTWKGTTNFLGWSGVGPKLRPGLRGPLAYIFGHRYQRLKKPDKARMFFKTAAADAEPASALGRLAEAALKQIEKPSKEP